MSTINVHILVKDELSPRRYVISGGEFDTMKAAVKATGARYDGDRRSWALPGATAWDALKQLRGQYEVTEMAVLRLQDCAQDISQDVDRGAGSYAINWQTATHTVNTALRLEVLVSQDQLGNGNWRKLPDVPVSVEITPAAAQAQADTMTPANHWQPAQVHGLSIARCIVGAELQRRAAAANDRLLELLRGKVRSKENIIEAVKTLLTELGFVPAS